MLFYFFSSVLLMKMVVGQIVGIINNVAKAHGDVRVKQESRERLRSVLAKLDPDHDGIITPPSPTRPGISYAVRGVQARNPLHSDK